MRDSSAVVNHYASKGLRRLVMSPGGVDATVGVHAACYALQRLLQAARWG